MCECQRLTVELKSKSKDDFEKIQELVNEFDPCQLIYVGAPDDEYDCLTIQLFNSIYSGKSKTEIKDLFLHEIKYHFETPDLETLVEPYKANFYGDLDIFLNRLTQHFEKEKPSP